MPHPVEKALWRVPGQTAPAQTVFLFVGGPLDGQRVKVAPQADGTPPERVEEFVSSPGPNRGIVMAGLPLPATTHRPYEYRLVPTLPVGIYAGEDVPDVTVRLVAGYKPGAADEK